MRLRVSAAPAGMRTIGAAVLSGSIGPPAFRIGLSKSPAALSADLILEWRNDRFHERPDTTAADARPVVPLSAHGADPAAAARAVVAFRVSDATPPLVLSRREANTQRIAALEARAASLRLKPGMGIAEARAIHPEIEVVEEDEAADRRLLEALADWCDRYTPLVAIEGARRAVPRHHHGCAHLFGGERALFDDLLMRLHEQGFEARAGLASTAGAAWAMARHGGTCSIVEAGAEAEALARLRSPPFASRPQPSRVWPASVCGRRAPSSARPAHPWFAASARAWCCVSTRRSVASRRRSLRGFPCPCFPPSASLPNRWSRPTTSKR